ncbi:DUF4157 domain-containing protein, partial [Thermogemmatispora sp.]|uniref:eCIS core domain-containing protein n=1 Tax=Thermogemmatispora sp. TaxID=1968838 RepID=UPI002631F7A2
MREHQRSPQEQSVAIPGPLLPGGSSSGEALSEEVRAFMEPRFGHDFSQVRIHANAEAAQAARALNARAYTVGQDIFFGQGEYAPQSEA